MSTEFDVTKWWPELADGDREVMERVAATFTTKKSWGAATEHVYNLAEKSRVKEAVDKLRQELEPELSKARQLLIDAEIGLEEAKAKVIKATPEELVSLAQKLSLCAGNQAKAVEAITGLEADLKVLATGEIPAQRKKGNGSGGNRGIRYEVKKGDLWQPRSDTLLVHPSSLPAQIKPDFKHIIRSKQDEWMIFVRNGEGWKFSGQRVDHGSWSGMSGKLNMGYFGNTNDHPGCLGGWVEDEDEKIALFDALRV